MRIRKFLQELSAYISLASGSIGMYAYYTRENLSALQQELQKKSIEMEAIQEKTNKAKETLSEEMLSKITNLKNKMQNMSENANQAMDNLEEIHKVPNTFQAVRDKLREGMSDLEIHVNSITESIKRNSSNFNMDDVYRIFDSYQDYLATLTLPQHLAFIHLCFLVALAISIINLASVFYSDSLIKYFELETRYPKLAKFFVIRRKLQQYYFGWHFFILIAILLVLFIFNLRVFLGF